MIAVQVDGFSRLYLRITMIDDFVDDVDVDDDVDDGKNVFCTTQDWTD